MTTAPPSGRVVLMFSDIEGSTAMLNRLGEVYGQVLDDHDRIMRDAFAAYGGWEFSNEGDAFGAAFADPALSVRAVTEIQQRIEAHEWPDGERVRVRMGLHLGEPKLRGDDYWGEDVHFAARVCSAAHGGQVVLSAAMRVVVGEARVHSLGHHGLKDFPTPRELFQLDTANEPERFPALETLSTFRSNLPSVSAPLIGRDGVLSDLASLFADGRRLVTLTGAGGMGKARVAIALGERLADAYPDGVVFVPLAAVAGDGVFAAVAAASGTPQGGDVEVAVLEHLAQRRMLVILDNCEHLVESAAETAVTLLERCPGIAILATAQLPLDLTAETVHRLPPLHVGVEMFVDRARAHDRSFEPGPADRERIEALCELVEGFPLAIELAAARVRLLGVERLLTALQRDLGALAGGGRDLPERHRSLRAALDWTVSLLSPTEREVFTALGAFAMAWTLEQAEALLAEELDELAVWDAMTRLMDASLVVVRGDGRFAMPQRVRQHASDLLDASPDVAQVRRGHAEVVGQELREIALEHFVDARRQFANIVDLLPEATRAIAWSRASGPEDLRHVVGLVAHALNHTGRLALAVDDLLGLPEPPSVAQCYDDAAHLFGLGLIHIMKWSTEADTEHDLFDRARRGFERFGDPREAVVARHYSIAPLGIAGRIAETVPLAEALAAEGAALEDDRWGREVARLTAVGPAESTDEITGVARVHGIGSGSFSISYSFWCAWAAANEGDLPRALALYRRSVLEQPREMLYTVLNSVKGIARVLALLGRDEVAAELHAAVHRIYLARTGTEHGDYEQRWAEDFAASAARLDADRLLDARRRGEASSYDDLVGRALALAEPYGSAGVDEGLELDEGSLRPGSV